MSAKRRRAHSTYVPIPLICRNNLFLLLNIVMKRYFKYPKLHPHSSSIATFRGRTFLLQHDRFEKTDTYRLDFEGIYDGTNLRYPPVAWAFLHLWYFICQFALDKLVDCTTFTFVFFPPFFSSRLSSYHFLSSRIQLSHHLVYFMCSVRDENYVMLDRLMIKLFTTNPFLTSSF